MGQTSPLSSVTSWLQRGHGVPSDLWRLNRLTTALLRTIGDASEDAAARTRAAWGLDPLFVEGGRRSRQAGAVMRSEMSLARRVVLVNSAVLFAACLALALGPATVSSPVHGRELVVLLLTVQQRTASAGAPWPSARRS